MPDIAMTPGNKAPGRYRKTTLSVAVAALIAAGASAPTIYQQFLGEKEGERVVAYYDGARIPTICGGLTHIDGKPVTMNMHLTKQQCTAYDMKEQAAGLEGTRKLVKPQVWASLSPAAQAGLASICWHNLGPSKCKDATFLRELNAGHRNAACAAITLWIKDGGRDCRKAGSGCQGQPVRRMQEDELCLTGIAS